MVFAEAVHALFEVFAGCVHVALGDADVCVSEEDADVFEGDSVSEPVGCAGVAEHVGPDAAVDARFFGCFSDGGVDDSVAELAADGVAFADAVVFVLFEGAEVVFACWWADHFPDAEVFDDAEVYGDVSAFAVFGSSDLDVGVCG